jgi:integrase
MSLRSKPPQLLKRKGYWYLNRRVPKNYARFETRDCIKLSTGIRIADDPLAVSARDVIHRLDGELFKRWRQLAAAESTAPGDRFAAVVEAARDMGMSVISNEEVANLPTRALVDRLNALGDPTRQTDVVIEAAVGTSSKPSVTLSNLREAYEQIVKVSLLNKSPRQLARWRTSRDQAVKGLIEVLGADKAIADLSRKDVMGFRKHWQDRIEKDGIAIDTANKNIGRIATMYRAVDEADMLNLPMVFNKTAIKGGKDKQRPSYTAAFLQSRFLSEGMFADINAEERRIIFLLIETGLRPVEACNLSRKTIVLDHAIPHVQVRPDGRQLKTEQSERDIPLVGVALMAMRLQPDGFPRYRERANELSAAVNKAFNSRGLRPNGESMYSLRHAFKDRMRQARFEDELMDELMGHKTDKPAYGEGYSLKVKATALKGMALRPPRSV